MSRRPVGPPSSEAPAAPPAGAFRAERSDTVKLSVAELKRQLEAHGLKDITEADVAVAVAAEDAEARLRRLVDD